MLNNRVSTTWTIIFSHYCHHKKQLFLYIDIGCQKLSTYFFRGYNSVHQRISKHMWGLWNLLKKTVMFLILFSLNWFGFFLCKVGSSFLSKCPLYGSMCNGIFSTQDYWNNTLSIWIILNFVDNLELYIPDVIYKTHWK